MKYAIGDKVRINPDAPLHTSLEDSGGFVLTSEMVDLFGDSELTVESIEHRFFSDVDFYTMAEDTNQDFGFTDAMLLPA